MAASEVIKMRPTVKLRFLKTCKSTSGWSVLNSHQIKAIKEITETAVNQRTQCAPNQSTSCPLSSTICSVVEPDAASSAKPR